MQDSFLHLGPVLPAHVAVVFPQLCSDAIPLPGVYVVTINLIDLPEFRGLRGYTGTRTFRDRCWARVTVLDGTPTNLSTLTTLATRVARDYYRWLCGPLDTKFVGTLDWAVEGLTDEVEFTHAALPGGQLEVATRVRRGAWNGAPEELLHQSGSEVPALEYPFFVELLGYSPVSGAYDWRQVTPAAGGGFTPTPGGLDSASNGVAYEANHSRLRVPAYAEMWPTDVCDWRFVQCCPTSSRSGSASSSYPSGGGGGGDCTAAGTLYITLASAGCAPLDGVVITLNWNGYYWAETGGGSSWVRNNEAGWSWAVIVAGVGVEGPITPDCQPIGYAASLTANDFGHGADCGFATAVTVTLSE